MKKKYGVTCTKLIKKKEKNKEIVSENSTFFCSELIAAIYRGLGLLPMDIPSSYYWPGKKYLIIKHIFVLKEAFKNLEIYNYYKVPDLKMNK